MRKPRLVGLKTRPTIELRSGIELATSRFIMATVPHALNHSAMEAVQHTGGWKSDTDIGNELVNARVKIKQSSTASYMKYKMA